MSKKELPLPEATCKGLTFFPIPTFNDPQLAFGAKEEAFFEKYDRPEVPREYLEHARDLFFSGGKLPKLADGVDPQLAFRAVHAWLSSWAPAHESKEATVGYALWLWTNQKAIDKALGK